MAQNRLARFLVVGLAGGLAAMAVGCGDDGTSLNEFAGTWTFTNSGVTFSCPDQPDSQIQISANKDWRLGIKSDLVDFSTTCDYLFDVKKSREATIRGGQTCNVDDGNGGFIVETPTSWVFRITGPNVGEEVLTMSALFSDGVTCTISGPATFEKLTKD